MIHSHLQIIEITNIFELISLTPYGDKDQNPVGKTIDW